MLTTVTLYDAPHDQRAGREGDFGRENGRVERWRGGEGFDILWVGVSPSVSQ